MTDLCLVLRRKNVVIASVLLFFNGENSKGALQTVAI